MEYLKIKDFAEVITGGTPSTEKNEYWENGTVPWIQSGSCKDDVVDNPDKYITELGLKNSSAKLMPKDTVVIALTGATTGKVGLLNIETSANQSVTGILPNDKCLPLYLFYYLISIREKILSDCYGGAQKHISQGYVKDLEIPIPDIDSQKKFIKKISGLVNLIKIRKNQIASLTELVKSQFVEMFSNCSNERLIGDLISISRGASPRPINDYITDSDDGINWIKIGDVSENSLYITNTKEKITEVGAKKSRRVYKGDFILSNSMSFGRPYILKIDGCVHDGWLIMSDFDDYFDEMYLYYSLRDDYVQKQFTGKVNGATVKNLNSDLVKSTYIKVPSMEQQKQFSRIVHQIDKQKFEFEKQLKKLEELQASLMQEYFG